MIEPRFPPELYVQTYQDKGKPHFDAFEVWQELEHGDVVAVYTLERVCKVKEIKTKILEDAEYV